MSHSWLVTVLWIVSQSIFVCVCVCVHACAKVLGAECNHLLGLGFFPRNSTVALRTPRSCEITLCSGKDFLNSSSEVFPDLFEKQDPFQP